MALVLSAETEKEMFWAKGREQYNRMTDMRRGRRVPEKDFNEN
jgi:hypothetical protein